MDIEFLIKTAYALGIGILIGLERSTGNASDREDRGKTVFEKKRATDSEELIGIRTYSILSLAGFTSAVIGEKFPGLAPVITGGAVVLILLMYYRNREPDYGITTELAAIATCGLGAICYFNPQISGVIALIITVLLASKRFTKKAVERLKRVEVTDTLKFLVIIIIFLPILPDRTFDPYNAFNPYKVAFLIILISGISFVGYFLTKFLGTEKGLGLTGFLGGLASSTAVTASMSNHVKANPGLSGPCAFAVVLANATMFARVLVIVAILDRSLAYRLVWPIGTMTLAASLSVIFLWKRSQRRSGVKGETSKQLVLSNPFSIGPAVKFALFFVVIIFLARIAREYLGNSGLYLASMISGIADVDAITLSIAQETGKMNLDYGTGAIGITIAVVASSITKSGIAFYSGGMRFGILIGAILLLSTSAGLAVILLM